MKIFRTKRLSFIFQAYKNASIRRKLLFKVESKPEFPFLIVVNVFGRIWSFEIMLRGLCEPPECCFSPVPKAGDRIYFPGTGETRTVPGRPAYPGAGTPTAVDPDKDRVNHRGLR